MSRLSFALSLSAAAVAASLVLQPAQAATVDAPIQHVLLVSIDGLHGLDLANFVASHPKSALAELSSHGVTFSNARTPANSDSFPGLLAQLTGGSPVSGGLFYDVSYDRTYFANGDTTCSGQAFDGNGVAIPGVHGHGSQIYFDESIDLYTTDSLGNVVSTNTIDPKALPYRLDASGKCVAVYPHNALKTNTVFEVIKAHGGVTAWADKHPAYDLVNGPSGHGVDDLYTPEITNVGGFNNTVSVVCTAQNDGLKVTGVLNQINGLSHDGKTRYANGSPAAVPALFGMNFQAVSVGQKLASDNAAGACKSDTGALVGQPGGYLAGSLAPTAVLEYGLEQTDAALQKMIEALKSKGLYDATLFIVSAKHGQSPINPAKVNKPGHFTDLVAALALSDPQERAAQAAVVSAGNNCTNGPCGFVQDDDVALVWLKDQSLTGAVSALLNKYADSLYIDEVMAGADLRLRFNDPATDSRTPDLIIQPQTGTIYTTSTKKNAEHGGFSDADTHVGLIVSNPALAAQTLKTPVTTAQIAPTILRALGISPQELQAVQKEATPALPGLFGKD